MRETLKLTPEQGRNIVYRDNSNFEVILEEIVDTSRWSVHYRIIVRRKSDDKFFESYFSCGATEMQDEQPYEYDDEAIFDEVKPVKKIITDYTWED